MSFRARKTSAAFAWRDRAAPRKLEAMAPVLEVENLRIQRGRTVILPALSWRFNRRENWVILGPNGSGKTSLLKALTGYLSPTAGNIAVLGQRYGACDWRD